MSSLEAQVWTPWQDHNSTDYFTGWTLTVPASHGALLASALTVIVGLAGDATWTIVAFALHQLRAKAGPRSGLFRMQQVVLRNTGGPLATAWELGRVGYAWRRQQSPRHTLSATGLLLLPLVIRLLFAIAGLLIGFATVAAYKVNRVLLEPSNCGIWWPNATNATVEQYRIDAKVQVDVRRGRAYAARCYSSQEDTLGCIGLPVHSLPYRDSADAPCPFPGMCLMGSSGALKLDTGILSSRDHLGINSRDSKVIGFQILTTCAPVATDAYTVSIVDPAGNGSYTLWQVDLGDWSTNNYTWAFGDIQAQDKDNPGYSTTAFGFYPMQSKDDPLATAWNASENVRFEDADTNFVFMSSNNVQYREPVNDPWFSANGSTVTPMPDGSSWIQSDNWFVTMACKEQTRICLTPNNSSCTPLTAYYRLMNKELYDLRDAEGNYLDDDDEQMVTAIRITTALLSITDVVYADGSLLASELVSRAGLSSGLPNDQWKLEVKMWYQTVLAALQHTIADFPNNEWQSASPILHGYASNTSLGLITKDYGPDDGVNFGSGFYEALGRACSCQIVRSTGRYQSFSMSAIIIVAVLSGVLVVLSLTLSLCVEKRNDRKDSDAAKYHKRVAHIADGKLQLLRMALKSAGYNDWADESKDYPYRDLADGKLAPDIEPAVIEHGAVLIGGPFVGPKSQEDKAEKQGDQSSTEQDGVGTAHRVGTASGAG